MLILILLPAAFLLPPRAEAGEIIGGREAKPHSRPYMAYLKIQRGKKNFHCGGFLVSKNFVLTAAHCDGDNISVLLGAHNVLKKEPRRQEIPVCRRIPHPDYNKKTLENDIMLLQGDSGGPLVCQGKAQGIVSYGNGKPWPPRVFTKISSFLPWIKETLEDLQHQGKCFT